VKKVRWSEIPIGTACVVRRILLRSPKLSPFYMSIEQFRVAMATHGRRK